MGIFIIPRSPNRHSIEFSSDGRSGKRRGGELYGRGGEFKGIRVVNVPPVISATDAGVLYAHPSSLKASLPVGEPSEYLPVAVELIEEEAQANIRKAELMQQRYSNRKDAVHAIQKFATASGRKLRQGGESSGTRVVLFCAESVENGKWNPAAPCSAKIVARLVKKQQNKHWQVSVDSPPRNCTELHSLTGSLTL